MKLSKDYKKETIESYKQKLQNLGLSEKSIGFFIRAFHVNCPTYFIIIMCYGPKWINILLLLFLGFALYSFIIWNGCFLSMIENSLDNEDITIIDPLIEMCHLEVNNKNRMDISIIVAMFYMALAFFIFMYRFILVDLSE